MARHDLVPSGNVSGWFLGAMGRVCNEHQAQGIYIETKYFMWKL
jgi:hypothetical protein